MLALNLSRSRSCVSYDRACLYLSNNSYWHEYSVFLSRWTHHEADLHFRFIVPGMLVDTEV